MNALERRAEIVVVVRGGVAEVVKKPTGIAVRIDDDDGDEKKPFRALWGDEHAVSA